MTGTRVDYTYDQLNRLSTAVSRTGATTNWGLQFGYDIYGNRTSQTVTAGSAPQSTFAFDNNNRMIGYSYDANGNQLSTPEFGSWLEYDADNRMTKWSRSGSVENYQYHPAGWRVWKGTSYSTAAFSLYGPGGQLLYDGSSARDHVYFGGRLLYTMSGSSRTVVYRDRLGSTRYTDTAGARNYYPFGEEITATTSDAYKFAGTYRDSTSGLDYALNRYYSSNTGRFLVVDSGGRDLSNPQRWNRYTYALNDPINYVDRDGLNPCPAGHICLNYTPYPFPGPRGGPGGGGGGRDVPLPEALPAGEGSGGFQMSLEDIRQATIDRARLTAEEFLGNLNCAIAVAGMDPSPALDAFRTTQIVPGNIERTQFLNNDQYRWIGGERRGDTIVVNTTGGEFFDPTNVTAHRLDGTTQSVNLLNDFNQELSRRNIGVTLTVTQFQALILLHEFGHVVGNFPDERQEFPNPQQAFQQSMNNSMTIIHNCFK